MSNVDKAYQDLISRLISQNILRSESIIQAFYKIKRLDFVLPKDKDLASLNEPLAIGHEQTISQPLTVGFMLELLSPSLGDCILDVGSGSGWTVALLSEIVGQDGRVYGLERVPSLKQFAEDNVAQYNFIECGTAKLFCRDGYNGLPEYAPFDKIIVAAAAEKIPPKLKEQLKIGGRLIVPVGEQLAGQDLVVIERIDDNRCSN